MEVRIEAFQTNPLSQFREQSRRIDIRKNEKAIDVSCKRDRVIHKMSWMS